MMDVLHEYEETRRTEVLKIQNAARNSMQWFENVKRYTISTPSSSPTAC